MSTHECCMCRFNERGSVVCELPCGEHAQESTRLENGSWKWLPPPMRPLRVPLVQLLDELLGGEVDA